MACELHSRVRMTNIPNRTRSRFAAVFAVTLLSMVALRLTGCSHGDTDQEPATSTSEHAVTLACLGAEDCAQGQDCVCGPDGCACGTATDTACDQCQGDGDCGDGQCCFQGECIAANDTCACGQRPFTANGSGGSNCEYQDDVLEYAKAMAEYSCPSNCSYWGDGSGSGCEGGTCTCDNGIQSENVDCDVTTYEYPCSGSGYGRGSGSGSGSGSCPTYSYSTVVATVCATCEGPPLPADPCDDIREQIQAKKMEITKAEREIALLKRARDANAAARDSWQAKITALNGLEQRIINGQFGENILLTTTGHSISAVTDVIAIGKAAKFANGVRCTGTKVCNILRVNRQRGFTMSVKHTLKSDVTAREVYTPAAEMLGATAVSQAANGTCPTAPGDPPPSWKDWVPLYKDFTWGIGCYSAQYRIDEIGENRSHATNSRNFYKQKVEQLEAQIATKTEALGVLKHDLAQLEADLAACEQCGSGSGSAP